MALRSEELLGMLRTRHHHKPKVWISDRHWSCRSVYVGQDGASWHVTYSDELPEYQPFHRADVDDLLRRGLIAPDYPGTDAETGSFHAVD